MDNNRISVPRTKGGNPLLGKTRWLGLAFPCAMVALGIFLGAPYLGWLGAAVLLVQAFGYRRWLEDRAVVASAQASSEWMPARLEHEQFSDSWGWKLEVSLPSGTVVWLLTSTGDFREELPLQVEVCDLGLEGLLIRYEDRLVLTRVESRG